MNDIISTEKLTKHFGKVCAVDQLFLNVRKGEIYGFLGMNGAGKTTTIRMLLGMIHPTQGAAYLNGKRVDAGSYDLWKDVGYLVEMPNAYPELTVEENLEIVCRFHDISGRSAIDTIIDRLKLNEYRNRKARNLSLGNAQRLGLAKALLHEPEILLLDEPANGLDPAGIVEVRELLLDMAHNKGVTVFISSHILGEISKLASRIGIIHQGRLVQEVDAGQLDKLLHRHLVVEAGEALQAQAALEHGGFTSNVDADGKLVSTDPNALAHPEEVARILVHAGCPLKLLKVEVEDLEAYFLRVTGGKPQ